jgi:hypothetical protein
MGFKKRVGNVLRAFRSKSGLSINNQQQREANEKEYNTWTKKENELLVGQYLM